MRDCPNCDVQPVRDIWGQHMLVCPSCFLWTGHCPSPEQADALWEATVLQILKRGGHLAYRAAHPKEGK